MHSTRTLAALALLFAASTHISLAQSTTAPTTPPAPTYSIVRYDEDYSYLRDPANRTDPLDALKFIPLGEHSYLSLGGQARFRYEFFNNNNFGAGQQDDNGYYLTRIRLYGDLHLGENFRVFVMGRSGMIDGREGGPRPNDANEADVQQAFADVILPIADHTTLTIRGGRQEMIYGAQRIITPSEWGNNQRAFEGAKVTLATPNNALDLFWVRPVNFEKEEPDEGDGDTSFAGVYDTLRLPKVIPGASSQLELYGLMLNRSATIDVDLYTLGARLSAKPKPWDFDIEANWQFGDNNSNSIGAYMLAVEGGYTFANVAMTPRAFVGFDIASGSDSAASRYTQLYPSAHHFFGFIDFFERPNVIDLHPGVTFKLTQNLLFKAEEHVFWRQNINDGLYNAQNASVRADNGSNAAYIGNEIDLLLSWQINRHFLTYFGYSHFFAGDFIDQTGAHEDIDFVYAAVVWTF